MNETISFTFDQAAKEFILETFGKGIDSEGYIVEKSDASQRVLTQDGQEVLLKDFAGLRKGSLIFVRDGLVSAIKLADQLKQRA